MAGFTLHSVGFVGLLTPPLAVPDRAPSGILRNPDFDVMDGWLSTNPATMYLNAGDLVCRGAGDFFYQPWYNYVQTPVAGAAYRLYLLITELSAGAVRVVTNSSVRDGSGNVVSGLDEAFFAPGYYVRDFIHDGDTINVQSVNYLGQDCTGRIAYLQTQRL